MNDKFLWILLDKTIFPIKLSFRECIEYGCGKEGDEGDYDNDRTDWTC